MAEPQVATPPQTLPALMRAKYPGVYDDLSDTELDSKVRAKFPGVYDDLPKPSATATPPARSLTGVEQATGIGPEPSFIDRAVAAAGPAVRGAGDITGANWLLEHMGVTPGRLTGDEANARDAATRHTAAVGGVAMGVGQGADAILRAATTQGLSAAGRAVAAARAAGQQITPQVKYTITRRVLQAAGVPAPVAFAAASLLSGYGGTKESVTPAEETVAPSADLGPVVAEARAARARAFGDTLTPEQLAAQASSGHAVPPVAAPVPVSGPQGVPTSALGPEASTRAATMAGASAPPATAPAESAARGIDLTTAKPETIRGLLTRWAGRAGVELSPTELETGVSVVQKGAKPSEVVAAIAQQRGGAPSMADLPTAPAERMIYDHLRRMGASHQDALQHVQQARALNQRLGMPSVEEMVNRTEDRNATGRWKE